MEKSILKKFATESRKLLMANVENQLNKYRVEEQFEKTISGDLIILKNDKYTLAPMTQEEYNCRERLVKRIKDLSDNNDIKTGIKRVIEESAYTWFNRIIAIRYMEVNDMLPLTKDNQSLNIRVLSSKDSIHPEILKMNNLTNSLLDLNIDFNVYSKLTTENEQFNYVLKKVCNKLGKIIPQIFDGYTEYINLLLPDNLLLNNGFVNKLIVELDEKNYESVEVIGWLYQYYNQDEKDRVINAKKSYKKDEIAYATQLFTPDWIVKYMVENSLGRYALEHGYSELLKNNWNYYVDSEIETKEKVKPTEIKFIDPCCGSGHILVYAFEVLMQIYKDYGYNTVDIPELILRNNIYGLDIDDRAGQLSILSVLLKAREYDIEIFNKVKDLNVMAMQESNGIDLSMFPEDLITQSDILYLIDTFKNAKEMGSLLKVEPHDYSMTLSKLQNNIFDLILSEQLRPLIKQSEILSQKYDVVVTNPPYMNDKYMSETLKKFAQKEYKSFKADLFSMFFEQTISINKKNGYIGLIAPYVWMFIKRYTDLREFILKNCTVNTLIQFEYNAFEVACVPVGIYTFNNSVNNNEGIYIKLSDFPGADVQEIKTLEAINNDVYYKYVINSNMFTKLPQNIFGYWLSESEIELLSNEKNIGDLYDVKGGITTANTSLFLKLWWEIDYSKIGFGMNREEAICSKKKWFPYNKGGSFRKWYGNMEYVINWYNDGEDIRNYKLKQRELDPNYNIAIAGVDSMFLEQISWSLIGIGNFNVRYYPNGFLFDVSGCVVLPKKENKYYLMALLNSKISERYIRTFNPTMNTTPGDVKNIPYIIDTNINIDSIVKQNIDLCKEDWDSYETSWDFKKSNLLVNDENTISKCVYINEQNNIEHFNILKKNEEFINNTFINMYNLSNKLNEKVDDKDVSISIPKRINEIKSLISYFVGCLFGRYSLDEDGLIYAGGEFDINRYNKFKPDIDNIIPITDTEYFKDDIVSKFKEFLCIVFSEETLNENMDYIAEVLGKKSGETSEDTIRRYFVNDFFKDHIQTYQKKPIYWLLDSGKKNGFKALFYLHRYDKDLISRVRLDYIGKIQTIYENRLKEIENDLNSSLELSTYEVKQLEKEQNSLYEKLDEVKKYYVKLSTIGDKNIELDLDDGVTENYKLFNYVDPETNEESSILGEAKVIAPKKK